MSKIKYTIILIVTIFAGIGASNASIPPSWTVNPSSYGFNMTLTGQVELNCVLNTELNDTIAAFVGNECRGVASTGIGGFNLTLMLIYSNTNSGEEVTFKYYDTSHDTIYNLSQTVMFLADSSIGSSGTPFQIQGSYTPTAIELDNQTIYDTTDAHDLVGTISVIDLDVDDVYELELLETLDYDHFYVQNNQLFVAQNPNVITDEIYQIILKGTAHETCVIEDTFQISLVNTYIEPIEIHLSNDTVFDYSEICDTIGLFSLENVSDFGTFYSLIDTLGTDYGYFVMVGNELVLNHNIDILTETAYSIYMRAYGGTSSFVDQVFTIHINNTNTSPTALHLSNDTVYDYSNPGDFIGSLTVDDINLDANYTYSFDGSGNHQNDYFILTDNELYFNHNVDILTETSYQLHLKAYDGVAYSIDSVFTITLNNTNDEPTAIELSNTVVFDYTEVGTLIGDFSVLDVDTDAVYTYELLTDESVQNDYFILTDNQLYLNHEIDILTETSYQLHLKAYDGVAYSIDSVFTITINNTNDEPTAIELSNSTVFDYTEVGTLIGDFSVLDVDTDAVYTYELMTNETVQNDYFILTDNQLYLNHEIDILTETSYQLHLKAYDGVAYSIDSVFTITINNTNDEPTAIELSNDVVFDYTEVGTLIGAFSVLDVDTDVVYTYELMTNESVQNDYFILTDNQLYLNHDIDILTETSYQLHLKAYDGVAYSIDSVFTITIDNTNDEPTAIELSNSTVFDYTDIGTLIGGFSVLDVDTDAVYTYELMTDESVQNDYFILTDNQLYLNHEIDILTETSYQLHLTAYDGVAYSIDSVFTITINNTNDEPTAIELSNSTVFDYTETGALIGDFSVLDVDTDAVYTYQLMTDESVQNDYFILTDNQLYLNHEIDILTETSYQLHLKAYDGVAYSIDSIFTITINNTNLEPTAIELSNAMVYDYSKMGELIGEFSVLDVNTDAVYTYELMVNEAVQNDYFILTGNQLYLNHEIDILTETSYQLHIKAYDGVAYSIDSVVTIVINNTNNQPTAIELSNNIVYDYSLSGDIIGDITVADIDTAEVYTLSLDSTVLDNDKFLLSGGQLVLNHEINAATESVYHVQLQGYDGHAYSIIDTLHIVVNNTNIYPYSIQLSHAVVYDYSIVGDTVGQLNVDDANSADVYSYSLLNSNAFFLLDNYIVLNQNINVLNDSSFTFEISAYDGVLWTIDSVFTITVENTNIEPSLIELSNTTLYDYTVNGDQVGLINVLDVNSDANYTYSLGSNYDENLFQLVNNELQFTGTINPLAGHYQVELIAYDGVLWTIDSVFTIMVENTNEVPTSIEITNSTLYDYTQSGDDIGTLNVVDANSNANYTYSLESGYDEDKFHLVNNELQFIGVINPLIGSYEVKISGYDGVLWTIDSVFTITVENTNAEPTYIELTNTTIYDYTQSGNSVGGLSVVDLNLNTNYTYSLATGYDEDNFQLVNDELQFIGSVDPIAGSYQVKISAYDGVLWTIDSVFTITVENTNAQPTSIELSNDTIYDYTQVGDVVGTLNVLDLNSNANYTYSLGTQHDENLFQMVNGELQCIGNVNPLAGNYLVELIAYDGVLWTIDSVFTITVENTNAQPTSIELSNTTIYDYTQVGDAVGILNILDLNSNANYTYSLGTQHDENAFQLVNGELQCIGNVNPLAGSYQVEIIAYDGVLWTIDSVFTITVENTNAEPTSIELTNTTIYDYTQSGTVVGSLSVIDANSNANYSYTLGTGYNEDVFQLVNGDLQFIGLVDPQIGTYQVEVMAYDGVLWTIDSLFTISVENTNEAPTSIEITNSIIYDYTQSGDVVGGLHVVDPNLNTTYTYSLGVDNDEDLFQLVNGELQVIGTIDPMIGDYFVEVIAYDGVLWTIDTVFTITVENTNEAPTSIEITNSIIYDYTQSGDIIGTLSVTDINADANYTYNLGTGNHEHLFQLVNGELQVIGTIDPTVGMYQVEIIAYDGVLWTIDRVFTITVENTNIKPTGIHLSNSKVYDYTTAGTDMATLSVNDANANESYTYTLENGYDEDQFQLIDNVIEFIGEVDINKTAYEIHITAYDGRLWTIDSVFTIDIENTNTSPTQIILSNSSIEEDLPANVLIAELDVEDEGSLEAYVYELTFTEGDNDNFEFDLVDNQLFATKSYDYETQSVYTIEVTVTDVVGQSLTQVLSISIVDVIEEEVLLNNNYLSPNGDGINDVWEVENVELYEEYSLEIYNTYGQRVYEVDSGYDNTWSGVNTNGDNLPQGVYVFYFKSKTSSMVYKGSIHILN